MVFSSDQIKTYFQKDWKKSEGYLLKVSVQLRRKLVSINLQTYQKLDQLRIFNFGAEGCPTDATGQNFGNENFRFRNSNETQCLLLLIYFETLRLCRNYFRLRNIANRSRGLIIRTQKGPRLIHSYMSCTVNLDLLEPYSRAQQTFTINLPRSDVASKTSREDASDAPEEKSPFYSFYRRLFRLKKMKWKEGETPLREMTAASKERHRTKKGSWGDRDPLKLGSFLFFFVWFLSFFLLSSISWSVRALNASFTFHPWHEADGEGDPCGSK